MVTNEQFSPGFSLERFVELVLHVADRSMDDPRFGLTKLNKILYFSDFKAYGLFGHAITGATYLKMDRGPVPDRAGDILSRMEREGEIAFEDRRYFNYRQRAVRPLRRSRIVELVTPEELELVERVLYELRLLDASQVSALSHLERGWQIADRLEPIPYETVFLSDRSPSEPELTAWRQAITARRAGPPPLS